MSLSQQKVGTGGGLCVAGDVLPLRVSLICLSRIKQVSVVVVVVRGYIDKEESQKLDPH